MRSALFGLLCMAVLNVWGDVVSQTDLEYIEGRYCLRGTQQPYSGVAEVYHENGQLARRSEYLNGQLHGADNAWYADGLPQYRLRHLLGVPQGFGSVWYAPAARNLPTSSMRCSSPNAVSEISVTSSGRPSSEIFFHFALISSGLMPSF